MFNDQATISSVLRCAWNASSAPAGVMYPMPWQTAVEARARNLQAQKLPDRHRQVVNGCPQPAAQRHHNRLLLLAPGATWSAAGVARNCGHKSRHDGAACKPFAVSYQTVPPENADCRGRMSSSGMLRIGPQISPPGAAPPANAVQAGFMPWQRRLRGLDGPEGGSPVLRSEACGADIWAKMKAKGGAAA